MTLAQHLSLLRPLMTPAEIEALLGPEQRKQALDMFSGFQRNHGVAINFSHEDGCIDSISFFSNYAHDVAVCGLCIGMSADAIGRALPNVAFADGGTGEPDARGVVRYRARPASLDITIDAVVKDAEIVLLTLSRPDLAEVRARRARDEAERRAEIDRRRERANQWKHIDDLDQMLLSWAEFCSPWAESSKHFVRFARWLIRSSDPNAWHIVGTRWNWDYGHAPLLWITRQRNCDIATALEVFFATEPSYYKIYEYDRARIPTASLHEIESFDFLNGIRMRIEQRFYTRSEIAYNGQKHMAIIGRALKSENDKALANRFYPVEAGRVILGRDLTVSYGDEFAECNALLAPLN